MFAIRAKAFLIRSILFQRLAWHLLLRVNADRLLSKFGWHNSEWNSNMTSAWKRLKVVVTGFGIGVALSMFCATPIVTNRAVWEQPNPPHPSGALLVLFGPVGGPFAEPLAMADYSLPRMCLFGGVLLLLIGVHPCWPRWETGAVSGLGLAIWFLLGFSFTYASV